MAESNADVYASLGVNNAVMSSNNIEEHRQNMLEMDVAVRDGDDSIELAQDEQDLYQSGDKFASEADESRMQVRVNAENGETTVDGESTEQTPEGTDGEDGEFTPLGEVPSELAESSELLGQHEEGFQEMVNQAAERGLPIESIARIQEEYQGDGLTDATYEELAAAGYSKAFVDSYIKGQEALVEGYVSQIRDLAGGAEQFDKLITHMETNDPDGFESLQEAIMRRDLGTVKALLNATGQSRAKRFGKPAERSVTTRATPSKAIIAKVEGFETQADMVKAMSDSRYRSDAKYRNEVAAKVAASNFHW